MACIRCGGERTRRDAQTRRGGQHWRCNDGGRQFTTRSRSACSCHGFPNDVLARAVRWYLRSRLRDAAVVAWVAERGLIVARSTV